MHPRVWGRDMWRSIHYVALGYPARDPAPDTRQSYSTFFAVLGNVLPCAKCSLHYNNHITSNPLEPSLVGRAELFRWTVDLHNAVNMSLGRKQWTLEHAYEVYRDRRTVQDPGAGDNATQIVLKITTMMSSLVVVFLIFWWIRRRQTRLSRQ